MAGRNFLGVFSLPSVRAEEEGELVDPQEKLRERCGRKRDIVDLYDKLLECTDRVSSRACTTETCVQELFDYLHELDHCVSHSLFKLLK